MIKVLDKIVTGVSVVTTSVDGVPFGMTASWVARISNNPFMISMSIAHKNYTHDKIKERNFVGLNVMSLDAKDTVIHFGTKSGENINKFEGIDIKYSFYENPMITNGVIAYLDCKIIQQFVAGDHTLFLAEVIDGNLGENSSPMAYYNKKYYELHETDCHKVSPN